MVHIEVVPHKSQRYPTAGDWQFLEENLVMRISDTGSRMSNFLVAIHELVEAALCEANGVSEKSVDEFDMSHPELEEPGEDPRAPYHHEHMTAEIVERIVAKAAGIEWSDHSSRVDSLYEEVGV